MAHPAVLSLSRPSLPFLALCVAVGLAVLLGSASPAEARTRSFCGGFVTRSCGGHLQPECTSGAKCDPGHSRYSGSPFPITIDCPWPLADSTISGGCYDEIPSCGDCSAAGQIPCPQESAQWCTPGCDGGLAEHPITRLCGEPGTFPLPEAGANETCAPGLIDCEDGLQCTLALLCSHEPAREGETCDVTAPCGAGLYCQAGIPQICRRFRTAGEGCSAFNPCADGLSCEACFTELCNAPLQCFPNANAGAISEQQCRELYSPVIANGITGGDVAFVWAGGNGIGAIATESQAFGVAYGQNGEYGCYTSFCYGVFTDVGVTGIFTSLGIYDTFDAVGGESFVNTQSAQTPFKLLNFSTSQVFERFGDDFPPDTGELIGTEDALALGGGLNPSPFTAGSFYCETVLDPVSVDPGAGEPPPSTIPPLEMIINPDFETDLFGWTCTNGGSCAWEFDAPGWPDAAGSGRVTSPTLASPLGRIESSCVRVQEGIAYRPSLWIKTVGAMPGQAVLVWSSSEDCLGGALGVSTIGSSPADGLWRRISAELTAPAGARTVVLKGLAERDTSGNPSSTFIDRALVPEPSADLSALTAVGVLLGIAARRRRRR
jgi:hypothetical protein